MRLPIEGIEERVEGANPFLTSTLGDVALVIYFRDLEEKTFGEFVVVRYENSEPTDAFRFPTLQPAWQVTKRLIALEKRKRTVVITCK